MKAQTVVDARKERVGATEALELARSVEVVVSTRNGKVVELEPKNTDESTLLSALLGPTGNLRAPAVKCGNQLLVGFDEGEYKKLLKS